MMRRAFALRTTSIAAASMASAAPAAARTWAAAPASPARHMFTGPTPLRLQKKEKFTDPDMTHFRQTQTSHPLYEKPAAGADATKEGATEWKNPMENAVWSAEEAEAVERTHRPVNDFVDRAAFFAIKVMRVVFDVVSGYIFGNLNRTKILRRVLFLETAAGIPGMVAGTLRHLTSLRRMRRDYGWIHTLLEEAENERMHMLVFMKSHKPGLAFRSAVLITQGVFWNVFFLTYLVSPRFCHRFVGYLEEEAVRTYTHIIELMRSDDPKHADVVAFGKQPAEGIAIRYWRLKPDATMLDVMLAVRADEANHRDVNHTFANLKSDDRNPFLDHKSGSAGKFVEEQQKKQNQL